MIQKPSKNDPSSINNNAKENIKNWSNNEQKNKTIKNDQQLLKQNIYNGEE